MLSHILCLHRILEELMACNKDLILVFVGFSKTFYSIDRDKILEILKLNGIPDKVLAGIKVLYTIITRVRGLISI